MNEDNIVSIDRSTPRIFTLQEVNDLVPLLNAITKKHEDVIKQAMDRQSFLMKTRATQAAITKQDDIVGEQMAQWGRKVYKLGAKVLPGGYLGFDSGNFFW